MAISGYSEFEKIIQEEQLYTQRIIMLNEDVLEWMHAFAEIGNECVLVPSVNEGELVLGLENFLAFSFNDRIASRIHNESDTTVVEHESFLDYESDMNYSKILLFPPLGIKTPNGRSENLFVIKSLEMLKPNGRMVVLVPDNFLTAPAFSQVREKIMNEYSLEAVLPIGRIGRATGLSFSILVVDNKPQTSRVYMPLDLNSPEAAYKEYKSKSGIYWTDTQSIVDRIDAKHYDPQYNKIREMIKSKDTTSLGEAAEIYQGKHFASSNERLDFGDLQIIRVRDINAGIVQVALHDMYFCNKDSINEREKNAILQTGDMLISTRGHISWGIYKGESDKAIAEHGVVVIRPRSQYKTLLDLFFNSRTGLKYLESQMNLFSVGAVMNHLSVSNIAKIVVPDISVMKRMDVIETGRQLEDRVALMFKELGWEVKQEYLCGTFRSDLALFYNDELKGIVEVKSYKASQITRKSVILRGLEKVKTQIDEAAVYLFVDDELYLYECGKVIKLPAIPRPETDSDLLQSQKEQIEDDDSTVLVNCSDKETSISDSLLVEMLTNIREIRETVNRVETRVEDISEKIDRLSEQIGDYQSLVRKQIELAESEEEKDRLIHAFSEECTERIVKSLSGQSANEAYVAEKRKLQMTLGESAWNKLDDASKSFLLTSKILFNKLICMDDKVDYSGVCLLVTKALEVESAKRFGSGFLTFLKQK
ncbi:MAG: N-6 DNA methylase, partial [Erysipelotrichaceae bacterium]|nr:N-6 DNA methylase [Erysipelotrichaceae bacterium]